MLKLIIADDEKWVRTAIKSIIPFEKLELVLSSEAANGIEALELCRQYEPDILLTDIMMPGLNGLELICEIKKIQPDIRIVVISGYNDFEYAKTAMKFGVRDYLLKPIDENELIQVLERIIHELYEAEKLKRDQESEQEQYKKALPVICEAFLNRIICNNSMTRDNIMNELRKYGFDFSENAFMLCVTALDSITGQNGSQISDQYFTTLVKRSMKRYTGAVTFPLEHNRSILISIINGKCECGEIDKAFDICSRILEKKYGLSVSCGISNSTHSPSMLQKLFPDAMEALETRFWLGPGTLVRHTPECLSGDPKLSLSEDTLNKIVLNIKLSNLQTAISYIENVSRSLKDRRVSSGFSYEHRDGSHAPSGCKPAFVKEFYWQFIQSIIIMLNIQISFIRHETAVSGKQPYDRIRDTVFMSDLDDYVIYLLQNIFNFYHDRNPVDSSNLIENAKKVINSSFAGDISLEQVARHVHLSPAYLSELFKKQTGMSFIDYKTIVRIENAKKLLMLPSMNISEVSTKVGYTDPKYFSKLFKKITGKTIYEFRKENKQLTPD